MDRVTTSVDGRQLVFASSGERFIPIGFNHDRDQYNRLIEEYWHDEWLTVISNMEFMRRNGANVVRIHLQLREFMQDAQTPNSRNLDRLKALTVEAERLGLYLDITGLGSYRNNDPEWYAEASEENRWEIQARFWEIIAKTLAESSAVCWYDLINEPLLPREPIPSYVMPYALGPFHYINSLTRDPRDRDPEQLAAHWIQRMKFAIRSIDPHRLITVGAITALEIWQRGVQLPITSDGVAVQHLDLLCLHIYPEAGKVADAVAQTMRWQIARKPVVVEETFPLRCDPTEWNSFINESRANVAGWITFYWGDPISKSHANEQDALLLIRTLAGNPI